MAKHAEKVYHSSPKLSYFGFLILFIQGACSAAPFAFISSTLTNWYLDCNYSLQSIAWLSALSNVYIIKFLWANLCDRYRLNFTSPKGWILLAEIILMVLFILVSFLDPLSHPYLLGCVALMLALVSATLDINIDAYRIYSANENVKIENINLIYLIGFRLGYLIAGAGCIFLAYFWSWQYSILVLALLMSIGFLATLCSEDIQYNEKHKKISKFTVSKQLIINHGFSLFIFIFLFEFGNSMAAAVFNYYLLHELHYTLINIAVITKFSYIFSLSISPALGFFIIKKYSLSQLLLFFIFLESLILLFTPYWSANLHALIIFYGFLGLCEGLSSLLIISLYAKYAKGSTVVFNYAFLAAIGGCKVFITPALAIGIIDAYDWNLFYVLSALSSALAIPFIINLKEKINHPVVLTGLGNN